MLLLQQGAAVQEEGEGPLASIRAALSLLWLVEEEVEPHTLEAMLERPMQQPQLGSRMVRS
jgi:hypothetical protein